MGRPVAAGGLAALRLAMGFGLGLGLGLAACRGSDPAEMARERGAVELLTAWRCGATHFIDVAGGDLKTDWTATRVDAGSYRVSRRAGAAADSWTVRVAGPEVSPDSDGARAAWTRCAALAAAAR